MINADDVWQLDVDGNNCLSSGKTCLTGEGVTIGVIDTGVDYTHEDLGWCFGEGCKVVGGYDFVNTFDFNYDEDINDCYVENIEGNNCEQQDYWFDLNKDGDYEDCYAESATGNFCEEDNDPMDDHGHGTHVAATAAGNGVLKGVAPGAEIYAYKVLDSYGSGYENGIIGGIERAVDPNQDGDFSDHLDIISMSLGGSGNPDDPMSQAIDNAVDAGVVAVIAAGNDGPNSKTIGSPGTARKAITVGAVDKNNQLASFSSRGPVIWTDENGNEKAILKPDVVAPGVNICAAQWEDAWSENECLDSEHTAISGTSMATPHVAGAVALLKQKNPDWSPEEIKNSLKGTAVEVIPGDVNLRWGISDQGYGRIDILEAVRLNEVPDTSLDFYIYSENYINNIYDLLLIKGIFPEDYDSLIVEWRKEGESNWRNDGIVVIGERYSIAEFNPEGKILETGDYEFRGRVAKNGVEKISVNRIYFDKDLKRGWPKCEGYEIIDLVLGDITGDENKEIIAICTNNNFESSLFIFNNEGEILNGWPKQFDNFINHRNLAVGDIDLDGNEDIVLIYDTNIFHNNWPNGIIYVYNYEGEILNGWPVYTERGSDALSLVDLNNDGYLEVITGTGGASFGAGRCNINEDCAGGTSCVNNWCYYPDNLIHAFERDGSYLQGWPFNLGENYMPRSPIVITDLNSDGNKEIVFTGFDNSGLVHPSNADHRTYVIDNNAKIFEGFPFIKNGYWGWTLASGDVNGDGNFEIITQWGIINNLGQELFWENKNTYMFSGPSLGDMNEDGYLEVVYGDANGKAYLINYLGERLMGWPVELPGYLADNTPLIADFNGDGIKDVFVGYMSYFKGKSGLHVYNIDGSYLTGYPKFENILAIDSILLNEQEGKINIILADNSQGIFVFETDTPYNPSTMDWPMFQHDPQHTGCYDCDNTIISTPNLNSIIENIGNQDVNVRVIMKIQKKVGDNWQDYLLIKEDNYLISANGNLNLAEIWNSQLISINEGGNYRAYVKVINTNENSIEKVDEFNVE